VPAQVWDWTAFCFRWGVAFVLVGAIASLTGCVLEIFDIWAEGEILLGVCIYKELEAQKNLGFHRMPYTVVEGECLQALVEQFRLSDLRDRNASGNEEHCEGKCRFSGGFEVSMSSM
jgi:hypothetical protein